MILPGIPIIPSKDCARAGEGAQVVPVMGEHPLLPQHLQRDGTRAKRFDAVRAWQGAAQHHKTQAAFGQRLSSLCRTLKSWCIFRCKGERMNSSYGLSDFSLHSVTAQELIKLDLHGHSGSFIWNPLMTQVRQICS